MIFKLFVRRLNDLERDTSTRPAHVIGHLPEDAAKVTCNIGNNAPATLGWIAEDYVAHLKHHLNQILGQTFVASHGNS